MKIKMKYKRVIEGEFEVKADTVDAGQRELLVELDCGNVVPARCETVIEAEGSEEILTMIREHPGKMGGV